VSAASPLRVPAYRRLFGAQIASLLGTGVATIALGLLAYDLAGDNAGAVLGGVLALKMVAYVGLSPVIAAFAHRFDRRRLLVGLDLARASTVAFLPFVTEIWQVFVLVFVLNAAAAGFTPAFQATIPEVITDERAYTRALSQSRLAYDLQDLAGPAIAAALLVVLDFRALFALEAVAFLGSAALVLSATLPAARRRPVSDRSWERITSGVRSYLRIPRLRGLLALNLAVASASAMIIVNTVVLVRGEFGEGSTAVAVALGAAGAGSMLIALTLPRVLDRRPDRPLMLLGGVLLPLGLVLTAAAPGLAALLGAWFVLGIGMSLVQTPAGRLIQRSGTDDEWPALFAAQFSLSHACWLLTYPLAGVLGSVIGVRPVAIALAALAAGAAVAAGVLWRTPGERTNDARLSLPAPRAARRTSAR
jgi:MFS family permease